MAKKMVIGHHSENVVVQSCKKQEQIHLADATYMCYNFAQDMYVQQHLGDGGGGEADVHKRQIG